MTTPEVAETKNERVSRKTGRSLAAKYRPTHLLDIPPIMEQAYAAKGFKLYWVRILDPRTRQIDNAAVSTVLDIGGGLITPDEVKVIDPTFLARKTRFDYTDEFGLGAERSEQKGIQVSDVVLVKVPLSYVEDRANYIAQMSGARLQSAFSNVRRDADASYAFKSSKAGQFNSRGESF